jgi:pimeloyl-ACP methyl ester carboxylesterase
MRTRTKRLIWILVLIAALIPATLAAYAAAAEALFYRRHPPPGRLHDLGQGRRLHMHCTGTGSPAVIFESSLGGSSVDWYAVQPKVATLTSACAYDRAGAGWSDAAPLPRDPIRTAEDLHAALGKAGIAGPYVLVGHSYGGYVARVFAGHYRSEMAGVVLVDAVGPETLEQIPSIDLHWRQAARDCRWDELRAIFAVFRLRGDSMTYVPPQVRPVTDGFFYSRKLQDDSCGEIQAMIGEGRDQVRAAGSFDTLPLAVVTAGKSEYMDADDWRRWQQVQKQFAQLSRRSSHVVAANSTHHVQFSEPDVIAAAVAQVVTAARAGTPQ